MIFGEIGQKGAYCGVVLRPEFKRTRGLIREDMCRSESQSTIGYYGGDGPDVFCGVGLRAEVTDDNTVDASCRVL